MNTTGEKIYHYTNLNAFKSIIETGEIWFTRVDCLNDSSEYVYYKDVFNRAREEFIQEQNVNVGFDLMLLNDFLNKDLLDLRDKYYKRTFSFSLSIDGDSIPMWNYYSNKTGIVIGFDKSNLIKVIHNITESGMVFSADNIKYDEFKQKDSIKYWLYEVFKIANDPKFLLDPKIHNTLDKIRSNFGAIWGQSNFYKDESFKYESEFRISLCDFNDTDPKIHWIVTDNNIKPVIKIKVAENWNDIITNIVISPYNQSKMIEDNIHEFLIGNGINIDKDAIIKSNCPIRNL